MVPFLGRGKDTLPSQNCAEGLWRSSSNGHRPLFSGVKAAGTVKLSFTYLHLVSRLRTCGLYPNSRTCLHDVHTDFCPYTKVYVPYFNILKSCMISGVISDIKNNQIASHDTYVTTLTLTLHISSPSAATPVRDITQQNPSIASDVFHNFFFHWADISKYTLESYKSSNSQWTFF